MEVGRITQLTSDDGRKLRQAVIDSSELMCRLGVSDAQAAGIRNVALEEAAAMLQASYPDNVSTNAFCAAIRSLKTAR